MVQVRRSAELGALGYTEDEIETHGSKSIDKVDKESVNSDYISEKS